MFLSNPLKSLVNVLAVIVSILLEYVKFVQDFPKVVSLKGELKVESQLFLCVADYFRNIIYL